MRSSMKTMLVLAGSLVLITALSSLSQPQDQTWTGEISDSHCRLDHEPLSEGDPVLPSPDCVKLCLKSGFKYVFAVEDKVYSIANQNQPDLAKFAGQKVKLSGHLTGDTLTVSKIEETRF